MEILLLIAIKQTKAPKNYLGYKKLTPGSKLQSSFKTYTQDENKRDLYFCLLSDLL